MKRKLLLAVAFLATFTVWAQNIAVVSPSNETTIYQTLDDAIIGAAEGSVVYLPGGGFQIKDETKIDKRLTIMGVSHRGDTDNVDGSTAVAGNLYFVEGSSGSAVVGVFLSGNINVGTSTDSVANLTIRCCNINSVQVVNNKSNGIDVNQCYLRSLSRFNNTNAKVTNNITTAMIGINGGTILNNVIVNSVKVRDYYYPILEASNSVISYNVFLGKGSSGYPSSQYQVHGDNNQGYMNMTRGISWGEECKNIGDVEWADVFKKNAGVSISSEYHFKDGYIEYEKKIGLYGGTGFNDDTSLAPIPRIVSKKVAEQTDGTGRLKIEVTVKAQ